MATGRPGIATDQNLIFTGVPEDRLEAMLAEDLMQKYSPYPGPFSRGVVACTGSEFCRFAIVETKERALKWARYLDEQLAGEPVGSAPRPEGAVRPGARDDRGVVRMHFSGCSASCAQPQIADIGFRGEVAHVGQPPGRGGRHRHGRVLSATVPGSSTGSSMPGRCNDVPEALVRTLRRYQDERRPDEPFYNWARRVPNDELRRILAGDADGAAANGARPGSPA